MSGVGGLIHERVILDRLEQAAREIGVGTHRQARAGAGRSAGHVDLLLRCGPGTVAIEAELSPRRVERDLRKAAALGADELWIVVSNHEAAAAVNRRLMRLGVAPGRDGIYVLTLGLALQRLKRCFPFSSRANVEEKTNTRAGKVQ